MSVINVHPHGVSSIICFYFFWGKKNLGQNIVKFLTVVFSVKYISRPSSGNIFPDHPLRSRVYITEEHNIKRRIRNKKIRNKFLILGDETSTDFSLPMSILNQKIVSKSSLNSHVYWTPYPAYICDYIISC